MDLRRYFRFQTITWVNISGFSPNVVYALILWRSGLGLLLGKFSKFLTELSTCHRIVVGYRFTLLLDIYMLQKQ